MLKSLSRPQLLQQSLFSRLNRSLLSLSNQPRRIRPLLLRQSLLLSLRSKLSRRSQSLPLSPNQMKMMTKKTTMMRMMMMLMTFLLMRATTMTMMMTRK